MDVVLRIDGCGGARTAKTAAAGIVEEWWRDDLGLGNGGGRRPQRRWLKVKMVSAAVEGEAGVGSGEVLVCGFRRLVGRRCRWVSLGLFFFFFLVLWV